MGFVLSQRQEGHERVIAYGGCRLTEAQRNYAPFKGELFALLESIRILKFFCLFRPFIVRSDHLPLHWIKGLKDPPSGTVQRWLETLASYDFEVVPRKREKHGNADALSHAPQLPEVDPPREVERVHELREIEGGHHGGASTFGTAGICRIE